MEINQTETKPAPVQAVVSESVPDDVAGGSETDEDAPIPAGARTGALETVEEDEEEDTHREPVHDGRQASFPTDSVNPYLKCTLCGGYLFNAHTIVECMHSFCYNCLLKHIGGESGTKAGWNPKFTCPRCKISLGSEPMDLIKPDPTLQNIVDKLFPDLVEAEREKQKQFHEEKGFAPPPAHEKLPVALIRRFIPDSDGKTATVVYGQPFEPVPEPEQPPTAAVVAASEPKKKRKMTVTADTIKIRLVCLHDENGAASNPRIKPLPRPLLQTSKQITMRHLKKFLVKRLFLTEEKQIEILFKNRVMGDEYTLEFIRKSMGEDESIPVLNYRAREIEM